MGKTSRLTNESFIEKARQVHGDKYDYSKVVYKNYETKVCIICPEHGEFFVTPHNHLKGNKCPYCSNKKIVGADKTGEFIEEAKKVHGNKYDYSKVEYIDSHTKVCIICPEHGEFWQTPNNHLNGKGCYECAKISLWDKRGRITTEEFIKKAREIHGNRYDYSETVYKNQREKVKIICHKKNKNCIEHGAFYQTPSSHLNGRGCPNCRNSYLENKIFNFLNNEKILFEKEKTYEWLKNKGHMYLDFYLPLYNVAIECQGIEHFIPLKTKIKNYDSEMKYKYIVENDKIKKDLCDKNGIRILYFTDKCIYNKFENSELFYSLDELKKEIYGKT